MERVDDLMFTGFGIIQHDDYFSFGIDAVILASFGRFGGCRRVLDLGTGNGAIPLFLAARHPQLQLTGLEIQERVADMARRSAALNGVEDRVEIITGDLKKTEDYFTAESFDAVICNPPYFKTSAGRVSSRGAHAAARHEIHCKLEDVIGACRRTVRFGGRVFLVYPTGRMVDLLTALRGAGLEPKRLRLVQSSRGKAAHIFMVEAVKGGRPGLTVETPLIIYGDSGYTEEMRLFCFPEGEQ